MLCFVQACVSLDMATQWFDKVYVLFTYLFMFDSFLQRAYENPYTFLNLICLSSHLSEDPFEKVPLRDGLFCEFSNAPQTLAEHSTSTNLFIIRISPPQQRLVSDEPA